MNPYDNRTEKCPYCGEECEADHVDVGVGLMQCGPYFCENCGASEIGPEMSREGFRETVSEIEWKNGWYKAGRVSPLANTVGGVLVNHKTAKAMYDIGLLDEKDLQEKGGS